LLDRLKIARAIHDSKDLRDFVSLEARTGPQKPKDPRDLFIWQAGRQALAQELMDIYREQLNDGQT